MLTENIQVQKKEGGNYEPLPEDVYQVELLDITSEKRPTYDTRLKTESEKEYETVFNFHFVILDHRELRGQLLWANFIPTYLYVGKKGKNKLYQILEAFVGHEMTQEEEARCDSAFLNSLISKQIKVFIENKVSGDKKFNNIIKYMVAMDRLSPLSEAEKNQIKERLSKKKEEVSDTGKGIEPGDEGYVDPDSIPF